MNRKIGMYSSLINAAAVFLFALCMALGTAYGSYLASMFIAFSFVPLVCAFCKFCAEDKKAAAYAAVAFAAVYAVFVLAVYFTQVTTVSLTNLTEQAADILDYGKFGLFFNLNLFGYGMMALSTFFVGLTVNVKTKANKWLKWLLLVHGIFFIACCLFPMLGIFNPGLNGADFIGTMVLTVWCLYFIPVGVLSYLFFKRQPSETI